MKEILTICQSANDAWSSNPSVGFSGNQSLETVTQRIDHSLLTKSDQPWDFYIWQSKGERWENDDRLVETCDRWHLSHYEVCPTPAESKYQAIVILYYEPAVKVAIAV